MEKRKNAQTSERRPVAGCRDVLAAFDYPDANVAQAHAETALNMMTFLAAGNCDSKERATARSSTTTSEGAPSEPRRSYQLTMDSCTRDQFGFVEARGRIQNETSRSRSYYVEVEFLAESGVRIDFGNDLVPDVAPGQTAVWRAYGVVDYSGRFTCRYSAQSL
jgi:hypothetical protein